MISQMKQTMKWASLEICHLRLLQLIVELVLVTQWTVAAMIRFSLVCCELKRKSKRTQYFDQVHFIVG